MVFCYECDTLYSDLDDLGQQREQVNSFDENRPSFVCPRCGYEFEYYFMRNPMYWVPRSEWLAAGYAHLLGTIEDGTSHLGPDEKLSRRGRNEDDESA
jgi:hypothetical protein